MTVLKTIMSHFSHSTLGRSLLNKEVFSEDKIHALQKVGNTQFGSHYSAAASLLPAMEKMRELVQVKEIKFSVRDSQIYFTISLTCSI